MDGGKQGKTLFLCLVCFAVLAAAIQGCGSETATAWDALSDCPSGNCDVAPEPDAAPDTSTDQTLPCDPYICADYCRSQGFAAGVCDEGDHCTCTDLPPSDEVCGDGIDNNANGAIDENCSCMTGDTQTCYSGPLSTRNVGMCMDGIQQCEGAMEFLHWGSCDGEVKPSEEICDGWDNDCDGQLDEGCVSECYPVEFGRETICDNGIDDDCDGLIDCADPDCECCVPVPEICSNRIDDDCDGRTDCFDLIDCLISPPPEDCFNGLDDDCDRYVDCDDTDCCEVPECYDPSKCGLPCCEPGTTRWCDTPSYCSWGTQQCLPDGTWGTCNETTDRPAGCEGYYFDRECCLDAGECCMNYPYDDTSVGNCDGIAVDC
jgi:hypothetical protein